MAELLSVRLAPEWITDCLWVLRAGDVIRENCSPDRLAAGHGVPADLAAAIEAWDDEFQAVFVSDDPMSSGFPDEPTTAAWRARGESLAGRLAAVLGVRVEFHVAGYDRVFTP
ncbi:hypothetical protein [Umezawaea sp. Da 62-37]|uniref:hypothetical protein n=1 Tax=Umezawaea sp. Da 62-37 TaxID=3075927 RepID=UPI0028F6E7D2|nr:hypothetical protein [Umezawaea sp. Da 62-37]WNV89468.1 hypothetical protein RM788_14550 [Umezawaea sp. Da 62-37]